MVSAAKAKAWILETLIVGVLLRFVGFLVFVWFKPIPERAFLFHHFGLIAGSLRFAIQVTAELGNTSITSRKFVV